MQNIRQHAANNKNILEMRAWVSEIMKSLVKHAPIFSILTLKTNLKTVSYIKIYKNTYKW